jgi:hypothetical protein
MTGNRRTSTLAVALLAGALFAATLASTAQGVPPTRESIPPSNFESSLFCDFPLRVESLRKNVKITTFSDGNQLSTGSETRRLTNLSTGESLIITDAGNLITNPEQTTDTFHGRTLLFPFPGEPFGPGAFLFVGRVDATFAEPGGFFYSDIDVTGKRVDLCAALRG